MKSIHEYLQVPGLGLHVGPHFPERQTKFKEAKAKRKKMKSRAKAEKERKKKRPERQKRKADKVKRRAQKKEEERLKRAERGEPEVIKVKKSATNSHHGTEQIDSTILKLLRKSHRSKKEVPQKKENKVGRPEVASQWRGVREERHEASQEKKQRQKLKPNTPSPRHFLPDDSSSLQIPISAETSTLQKSFPEDPSSQDHHPRTSSPRHFLPDDLCSEFEADAVHSNSGDGAVELGWPLKPDYALPSSCEKPPELASPLPDRSPLDPEAFCMKFFQVIKKQSCIIKFI